MANVQLLCSLIVAVVAEAAEHRLCQTKLLALLPALLLTGGFGDRNRWSSLVTCLLEHKHRFWLTGIGSLLSLALLGAVCHCHYERQVAAVAFCQVCWLLH